MLSHQYNKLTEAVEAYDKALGLYMEEALAAAENEKEEAEGKRDMGGGTPSSAYLDVSNCLSCLGKRRNEFCPVKSRPVIVIVMTLINL